MGAHIRKETLIVHEITARVLPYAHMPALQSLRVMRRLYPLERLTRLTPGNSRSSVLPTGRAPFSPQPNTRTTPSRSPQAPPARPHLTGMALNVIREHPLKRALSRYHQISFIQQELVAHCSPGKLRHLPIHSYWNSA